MPVLAFYADIRAFVALPVPGSERVGNFLSGAEFTKLRLRQGVSPCGSWL